MIFDFNDEELYRAVRMEIMNQEKPFCFVDIFRRLDANTPEEKRLTTETLDELYKEGLIDQHKVDNIESEEPLYAFYTDKCPRKKSKRLIIENK